MRIRRTSRLSLIASFGFVFLLTGCRGNSDRPPLGRVSGKVTYNGKPVTAGSVIFTPANGGSGGHVATGHIESDGSYTLTTFDTGDGAVLGQHVVTVESREKLDGPPMDKQGRITYVPPKMTVPSKYTNPEKTPLRYTVEAGGKTIDLELKD
jgi:hypothetical protein